MDHLGRVHPGQLLIKAGARRNLTPSSDEETWPDQPEDKDRGKDKDEDGPFQVNF